MCEWRSLCSWLWLVALEDSQVLTGDKGKREISKDISNFWQLFQTKYQNKNTFWQQATGGGGLFHFFSSFDYSHFVFAAVEIPISPQFKIYILAEIHLLLSSRKTRQGRLVFCEFKWDWLHIWKLCCRRTVSDVFQLLGMAGTRDCVDGYLASIVSSLIQSANQSDFDLGLILKFDKNL